MGIVNVVMFAIIIMDLEKAEVEVTKIETFDNN
jgi:hypothetical protein